MIILDTNVLSALMRQTPDPTVLTWLDRQPSTSIWTSAITLLEIQFGLEIMPVGKHRTLLMRGFAVLLEQIGNRVAAFDSVAAQETSYLMAARHKVGRPGDLRDTMIAGIVLAHRATLATGNITHFEDIPNVVNPWAA